MVIEPRFDAGLYKEGANELWGGNDELSQEGLCARDTGATMEIFVQSQAAFRKRLLGRKGARSTKRRGLTHNILPNKWAPIIKTSAVECVAVGNGVTFQVGEPL